MNSPTLLNRPPRSFFESLKEALLQVFFGDEVGLAPVFGKLLHGRLDKVRRANFSLLEAHLDGEDRLDQF
jgi:hypothetical protein